MEVEDGHGHRAGHADGARPDTGRHGDDRVLGVGGDGDVVASVDDGAGADPGVGVDGDDSHVDRDGHPGRPTDADGGSDAELVVLVGR